VVPRSHHKSSTADFRWALVWWETESARQDQRRGPEPSNITYRPMADSAARAVLAIMPADDEMPNRPEAFLVTLGFLAKHRRSAPHNRATLSSVSDTGPQLPVGAHPGQVRSDRVGLLRVASAAQQLQVLLGGGTAFRPRDDVIELEVLGCPALDALAVIAPEDPPFGWPPRSVGCRGCCRHCCSVASRCGSHQWPSPRPSQDRRPRRSGHRGPTTWR